MGSPLYCPVFSDSVKFRAAQPTLMTVGYLFYLHELGSERVSNRDKEGQYRSGNSDITTSRINYASNESFPKFLQDNFGPFALIKKDDLLDLFSY